MLTSFLHVWLTSGHISNQESTATHASRPSGSEQLLVWESLLVLIFTNAVIV